jgi:uncharacterized membrane protein YeaQ/YmgE (transglycosylase-associated protein family)
MLNLLWMIIVGFFAGLIARALMPGMDAMGFWMTAGLGILGSVVGCLISNAISKPADGSSFNRAGFLMSIVGAIIVLVVARMIR